MQPTNPTGQTVSPHTPVQSMQPAQPTQPAPQAATPASDEDSISWTASEFIAHTKSFGWYIMLAFGAALASGAVWLLTTDLITAGMILIVALLFGVMGARKPRELSYSINRRGIQIAEKFYPYERFKSFSIVQETGIESIWLMPLQRFMPGISIYFDPADADDIADVLSEFLPFEPRNEDPLDRLMHRLRF